MLTRNRKMTAAAAAAMLGATAWAGLGAPASADGGLMVDPKRVVLTGRERTTAITLINNGSETTTYRILLVHKRMNEKGELVEVTEPAPGEKFADDMLRYSPKMVVLKPRVAQVVRLQVRKPAGLPAGEYTTRMLFQAVPPASELDRDALRGKGNPKSLEITLTPIFGISIPIFLLNGELAASAGIGAVKYVPAQKQGRPSVQFELSRSGERSLYGDVDVTFTPQGGAARKVGVLKGLSLYHPLVRRQVAIPLAQEHGLKFERGTFKVAFRESLDVEHKQSAVAELAIK